jgi:hypothetical protein
MLYTICLTSYSALSIYLFAVIKSFVSPMSPIDCQCYSSGGCQMDVDGVGIEFPGVTCVHTRTFLLFYLELFRVISTIACLIILEALKAALLWFVVYSTSHHNV